MSNSTAYNISNEHLLLIDILNKMYNDNIRQINSLNSSNLEIRNLIIQILNNNTNVRRTNNRSNYRNTNTTLSSNDNLGRIVLNNIPYVIESIEQVRIPTTTASATASARNITSQQSNEFSRILQSFFDPVDIYPTAIQIETATRHVRYCDIVSPKNTSCPISLTNFGDNDMVTVIRHCGHIFNTNELSTWFRSHCNCPVCRYDIRNDDSNASSLFTNDNYNLNSSTLSSMNISNNPYEILSSESNTERNTSSIINSVLYDFIPDYTSQDTNNFDSSSNLLSSALIGLINQMNNRSQR